LPHLPLQTSQTVHSNASSSMTTISEKPCIILEFTASSSGNKPDYELSAGISKGRSSL
jgi:hypothetical protein